MAHSTTPTGAASLAPRSSVCRTWTDPFLRVELRLWRRGLEVCTPTGEIDLGNAVLLSRALTDCEWRLVPRVVVDLSRVSFLAVAGARVVATAAEQARRHRRRVSVVVAGRSVRRVLELTGFGEQLVNYRWLPEALAAEEAELVGGCVLPGHRS